MRRVQPISKDEEKIKIVHLVSTLGIGGLEMVVLDLARNADRDAFQLHVFCLGEIGALEPRFEAIGVPVESLNWSRRGRSRVILRLFKRLRELRPDVLHTHNPDPHLIGSLAAALARVPVLVHTKHGRNYPNRPRAVRANRIASRLTNCIVPVSHDAARVARDVERVSPRKLHVIHNGVDLRRFAAPQRPERKPVSRAVHVARLNIIKDQESLLRAARIVCDAAPDFRLELIGDGPKRAELEALHGELKLGDRVRFAGFRDDVQRILSESDLFILSSISEGISITLLEAMAAGLPVVATDVGGNPEIVVDGETGLLAPARSPEKLAAAILELIHDPERASRMGQAGRRRVEEEFDVRRVARKYEDIYVSCLDAGGRRRLPSIQAQPISSGVHVP